MASFLLWLCLEENRGHWSCKDPKPLSGDLISQAIAVTSPLKALSHIEDQSVNIGIWQGWETHRLSVHTDIRCYWTYLSPSLHVILLLLSSSGIIWDDFLMLNQVCILGTGSTLSVTNYDVLPCYTQLAGIWPVYAPEWDWSVVSLDTLPLWVHSIHLKHCRSISENPSCAPSQTSFFPAVGLAPYTS